MKYGLLTMSLAASLAASPDYEPTSHYETDHLAGWNLLVNRRLIHNEPTVHQQTLALLQDKLGELNTVLPEHAKQKIHKVPIWIELDNDHYYPCICYHASRRWLTRNGFNPDKERSVEICNATRLMRWIHTQPWILLHEMAHAYHHQVLGRKEPRIQAAYDWALNSRRYDSVQRYNGSWERHYGLTNPREYFAESTEAYFGVNDYFPFSRKELLSHDPKMYRLLEDIWGTPRRVTE